MIQKGHLKDLDGLTSSGVGSRNNPETKTHVAERVSSFVIGKHMVCEGLCFHGICFYNVFERSLEDIDGQSLNRCFCSSWARMRFLEFDGLQK